MVLAGDVQRADLDVVGSIVMEAVTVSLRGEYGVVGLFGQGVVETQKDDDEEEEERNSGGRRKRCIDFHDSLM